MTNTFKPGDRVQFVDGEDGHFAGTVRSIRSKTLRQYRTKEYLPAAWWNPMAWYRYFMYLWEDYDAAKAEDKAGKLVSVHWDNENEFGCDGYDPQSLKLIKE